MSGEDIVQIRKMAVKEILVSLWINSRFRITEKSEKTNESRIYRLKRLSEISNNYISRFQHNANEMLESCDGKLY